MRFPLAENAGSKPNGQSVSDRGDQSVASIGAAIAQFEASAQRITAAACRANAERFSRQTFNRRFSAYVTAALAQHRSRPPV